MKARTLQSPVVVLSGRRFRLASASRDEREHTVAFDSAESPALVSCTCEAGAHGTACWAMARALDVLTLLGVHKVYVGVAGPGPEAAGVPTAQLMAAITEGGEMALLTQSATPLAGMVLNVP